MVKRVQLDEGVWFQRPLTQKVLDAACKDVTYLCELRSVLLERRGQLVGLYDGVNYYLNSLRELDDQQYEENVKSAVKCCRFFPLVCSFP